MHTTFNQLQIFPTQEVMNEWVFSHKATTVRNTPLCVFNESTECFSLDIDTSATHPKTAINRLKGLVQMFDFEIANQFLGSSNREWLSSLKKMQKTIKVNLKTASPDQLQCEMRHYLPSAKGGRASECVCMVSFLDFDDELRPMWNVSIKILGGPWFAKLSRPKSTKLHYVQPKVPKNKKIQEILNVFEAYIKDTSSDAFAFTERDTEILTQKVSRLL